MSPFVFCSFSGAKLHPPHLYTLETSSSVSLLILTCFSPLSLVHSCWALSHLCSSYLGLFVLSHSSPHPVCGTSVYMCVYIYGHMCVHTNIYGCVYMWTHVRVHVNLCVHTCGHECIHLYVHVDMCVYTCGHTHVCRDQRSTLGIVFDHSSPYILRLCLSLSHNLIRLD